jgi:tRNA(Arg) A34 adenosine deaminase TadA
MILTDDHVFSLLEKVIEASDHPKFRMAAAITMRNKIISFGYNRMKSHPLQAKYGANTDSIYLHAEISAIKNALKIISINDLKKCTLYVFRQRKIKGQYQHGLAKPCSGCMRAIVEFGIKNVIYTQNQTEIQ